MNGMLRHAVVSALVGGLVVFVPGSAQAQQPAGNKNKKTVEIPDVSLLDAVRNGDVSVDAEGIGDGRMMVSVTNNSSRKLNVVLPPGLIASGATGQFGGMGGM